MNYRQKKAIKNAMLRMYDILYMVFVMFCFGCAIFGLLGYIANLPIAIWHQIGIVLFIFVVIYYIFKFLYCWFYKFFVIYNLNEEDYKKYLFDKSVPDYLINTKGYKLYLFCKK